ncbi:MAG: hypothetical protein RL385_518 [Pseudomonadota bacterium]|jgi:hypothetical protein
MNRYGAMAQKHWQKWLPSRYNQVPNPEAFFTDLGEQVLERITSLEMAIAGDDPPGEDYLAKLRRLTMARRDAESDVLREMVLIEPEEGDPT